MAARKKTILILLLALLAVCGLLAVLLLSPAESDNEERESYSFGEHEAGELVSARVVNALDDYTVERDENGPYGFRADGLEGLPQDKSIYYSFARFCAGLAASYRFEDVSVEALADYGLDEPIARVELSFSDGESLQLLLGDEVGLENRRYFMVEGDEAVYAGSESQFTYFVGDRYTLLTRTLAPATGEQLPDWVEFTAGEEAYRLERLDQRLTDGYGNVYAWHMTAPVERPVATAFVEQHLSRMMEYAAIGVAIANPTDAQLGELGFDRPLTELVISSAGTESKITFVGREGGYYALLEGVPVIYSVADYMVTWASLAAREIATPYIAAPKMEEVSLLRVSAAGEVFEFGIEPDGSADCDGKSIEPERFSKLYKLACSLNTGTLSQGVPADEVGTVEFELKEGGSLLLSLGELDNGQLAVELDGADTGLSVRARFLETLTTGCRAVVAGEDFSISW